MKVGTGGNLGSSRKYTEKLFGPLFLFMVELSINDGHYPSAAIYRLLAVLP